MAMAFLGLLALWASSPMGGEYCERQMHAQRAVSGGPEEKKASIEFLRSKGPAGLVSMIELYDKAVERARETRSGCLSPTSEQNYCAAIDAVAGQKDAAYSRLFWHTDFEKAKAAAQLNGRPILSLRLLGKLDEELSCANSRFFRTVLYADPAVSSYLSNHYILHWQSVRPAPQITIDFGDGRRLVRTITGNSIHYIVNPDGGVVDAIPGLCAPKAFLKILQGAEKQTAATRNAYCAAQLKKIEAAWASDLSRAGALPMAPASSSFARPVPTAGDAAPRAVGKSLMEMPVLRSMSLDQGSALERLEESTTDETWARIAQMHPENGELSAESVAMMQRKMPAQLASQITMAKSAEEAPALRVVRSFATAVALDTIKNEYLFRSQVLRWLLQDVESLGANGGKPYLDHLNKRVYADLFLTPSSDPWLGLLAPDAYAALDNGGIVECR